MSDNKGIVMEVDPVSGRVLRTLEGTVKGFFGTFVYIHVDPRSEDNSVFWVADSTNNYVMRTNWRGEDLWSISKAEGFEIEGPRRFTVIDFSEIEDKMLIAIPNNTAHSITIYRYSDKAIIKRYCFPRPWVVRSALHNEYSFIIGTELAGSMSYIGGGAGVGVYLTGAAAPAHEIEASAHGTAIPDYASGAVAIPLKLKHADINPSDP
ncbi:MAG: hypothetical protein QXX84_05675 [Sulfolobales archaeon]|nr:hypothetical protein [Sulfolobales archaeon]